MKKIAIVTLYDNINIGNKLQNYALQELIVEQGCEVETIVNSDLLFKYSIKDYVKVFLGVFSKRYKSYYLNYKRKPFFESDTSDLIKTTQFMDWNTIQEKMGLLYDGYIAGSDQVWFNWLNVKGELEFRFLSFAPKEKRMCFAPSFGVDTVDEEFKEKYAPLISSYKHLSCRERTGCSIIKTITGREVELLCDPTMILSPERWSALEEKPRYYQSAKYVLVYFLSTMTESQRQAIKEFAVERKLTVIDIFNPDYPEFYFPTPGEFLYLIKHSEYIFTNSFHCAVFSIVYHKLFTVFFRETEHARMNDRIDTLLSTFDLKDRINKVGGHINYNSVESKLIDERRKGIEYLQRAIADLE